MRNLALCNYERHHLEDLEFGEVYCQDRQNIYAYSKGHVLRYEINEAATRYELCNLLETLYPVPEDDSPKAVRISYSYEKNCVYLFLFNGDIVSVDLNTNVSDVIGSVDNGIIAAEWSPEQELVTIITGAYTVLLMTNDFDGLYEGNLHGGGFGEKQFITVGWGKKETQFRGSEGKLRKDGKQEILQQGNDDGGVRISWRGDSEFFAVSSINPETRLRYIRIFNKEAVLQYTSEDLTGLEHSLHWRPSGNLIASSQKLPNKYNIVFFEKNGLKHGEFTLPFELDEVVVKNLLWNEDSKLLAVISRKNNNDIIQVYSVNNYHWYCKYVIDKKKEISWVEWDQRNSNTLHIVFKNENNVCYEKYSWLWVVNKSKGLRDKSDEALVGVIDGRNLLVTSFRNGIVPPPMCSYSLQLSGFINQVEFCWSNVNNLLVHLDDRTVEIYKYEKLKHNLLRKINLNQENYNFNINWLSDNVLVCCKVKNSESFLSIIDLSSGFNEFESKIQSAPSIIRPFTDALILIHDSKGQIYTFDLNKKIKTDIHNGLYPTKEIFFNDVQISKNSKNEFILFGLDNNNKFYMNDSMVANNVTSFHIHDEFLLLTTLKHQLLCLNIENELGKIFDDSTLADVCTRRIETGSRIVTSIPLDTKVILQMPRGNLECIQPRALSFFIIGKYLNDLNYYEAFDIMRKQRINLNLIYDHDPVLFSSNVKKFVDDIKDQSWISLFLSELSIEDVTRTMYSVIYNRNGKLNSEEKIKKICELVEKTLAGKPNPDEYLLPTLTTYIKQGEISHIEKALSIVKTVKEKENNNVKPAVSFNEAFRYMLYLIDVEELYKVALGMYDFDLVLLVADKSQKDPKEYLPFINDLRKLEINYQKYTIDKYLKRYEKALGHLMQCDGDEFFTECLNFIKTHKLFRPALKLVPSTTDRYKQICSAYGDELVRDHSYEEAGIMFSNAKLYLNAIKAFRKSGNWQEAISSAKQVLTDQNLTDFYKTLAVELIELKKFQDAATVYLDYLKNLDEAIITLCLGRQFSEAYRLSDLYDNTRIIQTHIKPGIMAHFHVLKLQITNFRELFSKQKSRLAIVREEKSKPVPDIELGPGEQDMFSETSTITTQSHSGSRTSNRTFRSSKNRRKQERKMLSLKEGSPFEDLALITSLHNIVTNCYEMKVEVRELNKCLIKIKEEEKAEELQLIFGKLLKEIEDGKGEIWNLELITGKQGYGPDATANSIAAIHMKSESVPQTPLLQPKFMIPPDVNSNLKWQLEILKP